jgi:hypothetical protein
MTNRKQPEGIPVLGHIHDNVDTVQGLWGELMHTAARYLVLEPFSILGPIYIFSVFETRTRPPGGGVVLTRIPHINASWTVGLEVLHVSGFVPSHLLQLFRPIYICLY